MAPYPLGYDRTMTRLPRPVLALGALAVGALLLSGCGPAQAADGTATSADEARTSVLDGQEVDAAAFAELAARSDVVVLDVRTPAEYDEGHLRGAVNLDVSAPGFATAVAELDPAVPYAVYCRSGNRSATAVAAMQQAGISDLVHLAGGIGAWSASGGEIVTD